jgi:hypothetical protein
MVAVGVSWGFAAAVALATLLLLVTFGYALYLGTLTRATRTGRVVFGTVGSLKGFVLLILIDFYVAILVPDWVAEHREAIRWGLVVYLIVQSLGTLVALERLRRFGEA